MSRNYVGLSGPILVSVLSHILYTSVYVYRTSYCDIYVFIYFLDNVNDMYDKAYDNEIQEPY